MTNEEQNLHDSLGLYYLAVNPGYDYVKYQQEIIIPALEKVERREIEKLMIWLPAGHSKSDIATRAFVPWVMGRKPQENVIVLSYSADLATKDFGSKIKERMMSQVHQAVFPLSKISKDSHGANMFRTISGGTFYAMGLDGTIAGKRAGLIVMDDLIKNSTEADSEVTEERIFNTYTSVIKLRLEKNPAMVLCMHRWRVRDIAGRILESEGRVEDGGEWTVIKIMGEDPPDSGNYLWAEHYGKKKYLNAKKDEEEWESMWQQNPQGSKSLWFKKDWLNFYQCPPPAGKFNTYMIVDPAGSKTKTSDYTSIHVWAAGQDGKLFLVDWIHDRMDPGERVATIMRLTRKWSQVQTIYEEYGLVNDSYYLTEKMREEGFKTEVYPIPVGRKGPRHMLSKSERIDGIIPLFREGKIHLPKECFRKGSDGKTIDLTKRFIDEEFSLYKGKGSIAHEDDLDCMSRLREPELVLTYFEADDVRLGEETAVAPVGTGWESIF